MDLIYYNVLQVVMEMILRHGTRLGLMSPPCPERLEPDKIDTTDFAVEFCSGMAACNRASPVKADFRGLSEYPGPVKNS